MNGVFKLQYKIETEISWTNPEIIKKKIDGELEFYYLNVSFLDNQQLWSVRIHLDSIRNNFIGFDQPSFAQISFLFEDLIIRHLSVGMEFWLSEGPPSEVVGNGVIRSISPV